MIARRIAEPTYGRVHPVFEINERVVAPQPLAQFVARDQVTRPLEQSFEDFKRLTLQGNARTALAELAGTKIELEYAEPNDRAGYGSGRHDELLKWIQCGGSDSSTRYIGRSELVLPPVVIASAAFR